MSESAPALILSASGVTKRFGGLVAVNAVDFDIPEGSIVSLIGPNGAGKTTFFNVVAGLYEPTHGSVRFMDNEMIARGRRAWAEPLTWVLPTVIVALLGFFIMQVSGSGVALALAMLVALGLLVVTSTRAAAPLDLASLRGQVVYLDFWASWCVPCRQSFPWLQSMINAYQVQGLAIVAVNLDRERIDADRFLDQFKPTFEVRFDPQGESAEFYKIKGMPASLLIDRHGVTRFAHVGFRPVDSAAYETQLRELLAEK